MLEIKTKLPHLLIDCLLKDNFPPEHRAQCQGALWVAEREWIDIAVYWPGLPLFVKRAHRDEEYINQIASAVAQFNEELAEIVAKVRNYGMRVAA
jgi:predicted phage-related endonuclease